MANDKQLDLSMEELDLVVQRCIAEEYTIVIIAGRSSEGVHLSLEKGSTYGTMHMKFSAAGDTILEAFNKAYANFPANPVGARWDTKRIAAPPATTEVTDGEFTEYHPPQVDDLNLPPSRIDLNDDTPF